MEGVAVVANLLVPFARPCICCIFCNPLDNPVDNPCVRMAFYAPTQCAMHAMYAMLHAMLRSCHTLAT